MSEDTIRYHQGFPELSVSSLFLRPDVITLVETHLAGEPLQMKLPRGYTVAACHDRSRHGGGVLLLCREDLLMDVIDCEMYYYVSETSEIVGVHYQETLILCVYRQPSATNVTLIDSLTRFRLANRHYSIIVGDFNVHEREWLGSPFTFHAGTALREFCELFGLSQLVDQGTGKDAILDLAISEHTGTVSYHGN